MDYQNTTPFQANMPSSQAVPMQPSLFNPPPSATSTDNLPSPPPIHDSGFTNQSSSILSLGFSQPPPPQTLTMSSIFRSEMSSPPPIRHDPSSLLEFLKIPKPKVTSGSPSTPDYSAFTVESNVGESPVSSSMPTSVPQVSNPPMMPFLPTSFDNASVASGFRDYRDFTPPPKTSKDARKFLLSILAEKSASDQNSALSSVLNLTSMSTQHLPQPSTAFSPPPLKSTPTSDSHRSSAERTSSDGKTSTNLRLSDKVSGSDSMSSTDAAHRSATRQDSDANNIDSQKHQPQLDSKLAKVNESEEINGLSEPSRAPIETYLFPLSPFCAITLSARPGSIQQLGISKTSSITEFAGRVVFYPTEGYSMLGASPTSLVLISSNSKSGAHVFNSRTGSEIILADHLSPIADVAISWERDISLPFSEFVVSTSASGVVNFSQLQGTWQGTDISFLPSGLDGSEVRSKPSQCHADTFAISAGRFVRIVHPLKELSKANTGAPGPIRVPLSLSPHVCIDAGDTIVDFSFSSDDTALVTFDASGSLKFWDIRGDANNDGSSQYSIIDPLVAQLPSGPIKAYETIIDDAYEPASAMFLDLEKPYTDRSPHRYVLLGFQQNHLLQLWDLQLGKCVQELRLPFVVGDTSKCRITYHQQSGFLCVFHPARNSMLFLSLSFPQYRLLEKSPSGTLNKSAFTQLTQSQAGYLTLISSPKEARPPENTVIMKGVTEVSLDPLGVILDFAIRNVDLPRDASSSRKSEPEDVKDGSEKKSRRHKKKIEQHTLFELFVMSNHGVTALTVKPEDVGYHSDLKPILPLEPNNNELLRLTSISKAPRPSSMPRSQRATTHPLVDLTPSARNAQPVPEPTYSNPPVVRSAPEAPKPQPTNAYSLPIMDDDDPTYQSVLEEDDDPEFARSMPEPAGPPQLDLTHLEAHLATKFDYLTQALVDKHQGYVDSTANVLQQRSMALEETLRRNVSQALQTQLKSSANNSEKAVRRATEEMQVELKALSATLVGEVRNVVEGSFNTMRSSIVKMMTEHVNAAANKAADRAASEVARLLSEQQSQVDRRRRQDEEKLDKMMEMINNIGLGGMPSPDIDARSQGEAKSIRKLLRESSAEDAVLAWLGSTRQVELFDEVFVDRGPDFINRLSPESALAVAAVVTTSLNGPAVEYRLKWVRAIISHLESALKKSRDPELLRIIPHVMSILTSRLSAAKPRFEQDGQGTLLEMVGAAQQQITDLGDLYEKPTPAPTAPAAPPAHSSNMWMGQYND